jgi:hypothetical protein
MAFVTSDRQYRQVLSTSLAYRSPDIQDLVFNSDPVSALLKRRGKFKTYSGPEIRVSLQIDKLGGQWFTGYDYLDAQPKELLNDAVFTPKNLAVGFSLTGTELLANEGKTRIRNLLDEYMETAENSMADLWEAALHGDGTGDAGRQMIGFGGAIPINPATGTYGGIDRALYPIWRTSYYNVPGGDFPDIGTTWDSTTCRPILERIVAQRSKGRRHASVAVADLISYQAVSASMVAHQRIQRSDGGDATLGFNGLEVATPAGNIELFCATGVGNVMPANTIYGLDLEGLNVMYHPSRNMVPLFPGDGAQPINQDAIAQFLVWNGELVNKNPRFQWRLRTA